METKALKKQLGAAIAMVLVAAVALGSATYAWFVSNNTVKATTTNVSAQSNSAYLVIANFEAGKTSINSGTSATASESTATESLYPAQWKNSFAEDGSAATGGNAVYQFETAYASDKDSSQEKSGTRFAVGAPKTAADADYAYLNTFYIGTGTYDGIFNDLKVDGLTVNGSSDLSSAMRVLVTCGDQWVVLKNDGSIEAQSGTGGVIHADSFGKSGDVTVEMYVYYDGSNENVKTTKLEQLKDCGLTVNFSATPTEYGKTA